MAALTARTLDRLEDMLRPPRRGGALGRGRRSQAIRGQDYELRFGQSGGGAGLGGQGLSSGDASHLTHTARSTKALDTVSRITRKAPEVVVRRTGSQKSGGHALANFAYISRLGWGDDREIELTTNDGRVITNGIEMKELAEDWGHWHGDDKARRKGPVSYSLVFSMPAGTDAQAVKGATIAVGQRECPDQGWVVALHNDTDHVHAHFTVEARDQHGERQYFPRARLVLMREMFAEELRARGIDANATSRRARGVYDKSVPITALKQKEKDGISQRETNLKDKLKSDWTRKPEEDPIDRRMREAKTRVVEVYKDVARELLVSEAPDDKRLGMAIVKHLEDMPAPQTRYSQTRALVQQTALQNLHKSAHS